MWNGSVETILVGVDESDRAGTALEYAVAIAAVYEASVYALDVMAGAHGDEMRSGDIAPEALSARSQALLKEAHSIAATADVSLRSGSAYGFSQARKRVHPGTVVLDIADELDANMIVLPRQRDNEDPAGPSVLSRAASYALQYATQPVVAV